MCADYTQTHMKTILRGDNRLLNEEHELIRQQKLEDLNWEQ